MSTGRGPAVLVLCSDDDLRQSLVDLLVADGRPAAIEVTAGGTCHDVIVAAVDSWPHGWSFARLRTTQPRVPCVVLSGSPLGGQFAVTQLQRGYFVQLPALPAEIMDLVAEVSHV